ncbi:MAG: hypothetical protein ACFE0I_14095 [Elainellaceae cyanobacterium]
MKFSVLSVSLIAIVILSGCASSPSADDASSNPSPVASTSSQPAERETEISPENFQIYQDPNGWFALALPKRYTFDETDQGITFISPDEEFGGYIKYLTEQSPDLEKDELENILKQEIENQLEEVNWGASGQIQEDGSLRLDWAGIDPDGNQLDAVSFIEQHGETLHLMSAYGINQPYQNYNDDALIIVGTYVVRRSPPDPSPANQDDETKSY